MQEVSKQIDLKNLNKEQKDIVKYINQMIIEHQHVFQTQPEELLISKQDYLSLIEDPENLTNYKYLTLGNKNIKIYSI